jgi:hypothetical protein
MNKTNPEIPSESFTIVTGAQKARCHPITLDRAARSGALRVQWHLGKRFIQPADLEEFLRKHARRPR